MYAVKSRKPKGGLKASFMVCLFALTCIILHLVFTAKPTDSCIITDYLRFSIQPKNKELGMAEDSPFNSISVIHMTK